MRLSLCFVCVSNFLASIRPNERQQPPLLRGWLAESPPSVRGRGWRDCIPVRFVQKCTSVNAADQAGLLLPQDDTNFTPQPTRICHYGSDSDLVSGR